jgi:hypothetical protein
MFDTEAAGDPTEYGIHAAQDIDMHADRSHSAQDLQAYAHFRMRGRLTDRIMVQHYTVRRVGGKTHKILRTIQCLPDMIHHARVTCRSYNTDHRTPNIYCHSGIHSPYTYNHSSSKNAIASSSITSCMISSTSSGSSKFVTSPVSSSP